MFEMRRGATLAARVGAFALGGALALLWAGQDKGRAADHTEAPGTQANLAGDIDDFYAWHVPNQNKLVAVITYDGLKAPGSVPGATFLDDLIYTVHIDNNGDNVSDIQVHTRFGEDSEGRWGMRVENLPGSPEMVDGPVESINYAEEGRYVFAGLRDDPFFFDFEGFGTTASTGSIAFDSTRDSFAGTNVSAIVLEMNLTAALDGGDSLQLWATTGTRAGGR